ncbi:MAG: DNA N-6-adenine-methyltransferase [Bacteroidota bacterium]
MTAGRAIINKSQEWGTPRKYVDLVTRFFGGGISLDPCSNAYSIVEAETEYSLPFSDGLKESWDFSTIYVNPPYGIDKRRKTRIADWLKRCLRAYESHGSEVVALVPVATNTGHWKKYVWGRARSVCFLYDTRLKFLENGESGGKGAPMSCCFVYWGDRQSDFFDMFIRHGAVVNLDGLRGEIIAGIRPQRQLDVFQD